ncbi:MAG: hypothetical protein ACFFA5_04895 [Promethearchaeota archaeon]
MAQLKGFYFGQLQEDPSSLNAVIIGLRKYGVPYTEIPASKARLSSRDYFAEYSSKLPYALKSLYSSEYSRPPRAAFVFKLSPQPLSITQGRLLEHTLNWKSTPTTFEAFKPFCIPTDKIRQLTTIIEWHRLAEYVERPSDYSLNPILLTLPKGWLRVTKDHTVYVFNTHQHPSFIQAWLEDVIEDGRILSEVELVNMLDEYDPYMQRKIMKLLDQLKIFQMSA